jgi:hypothetical protein
MSEANPVLSPYPCQARETESLPVGAANRLHANFVGSRYAAYQKRWEAARHKGFSWNWAAFFFGPGWLAYRKMHAGCAVFLVFVAFETALEQIASVPASITAAIYLLVAMGFGASGDRLYKRHVDARVNKITCDGHNPAAIDAELMRQGGTNMCSALYFVATLVTMLVTIVVLLAEPPGLP